jgi:hypothetical protein
MERVNRKDALKRAIAYDLPQYYLQTLINSMNKRCYEVITLGGVKTNY